VEQDAKVPDMLEAAQESKALAQRELNRIVDENYDLTREVQELRSMSPSPSPHASPAKAKGESFSVVTESWYIAELKKKDKAHEVAEAKLALEVKKKSGGGSILWWLLVLVLLGLLGFVLTEIYTKPYRDQKGAVTLTAVEEGMNVMMDAMLGGSTTTPGGSEL